MQIFVMLRAGLVQDVYLDGEPQEFIQYDMEDEAYWPEEALHLIEHIMNCSGLSPTDILNEIKHIIRNIDWRNNG
jgi:hypothetical protein